MEIVVKAIVFAVVIGIVIAAIAGVWGGLATQGVAAMRTLQTAQHVTINVQGSGNSALRYMLTSFFGAELYPFGAVPVWSIVVFFVLGSAAFFMAWFVVRLVRILIG